MNRIRPQGFCACSLCWLSVSVLQLSLQLGPSLARLIWSSLFSVHPAFLELLSWLKLPSTNETLVRVEIKSREQTVPWEPQLSSPYPPSTLRQALSLQASAYQMDLQEPMLVISIVTCASRSSQSQRRESKSKVCWKIHDINAHSTSYNGRQYM